MVLKNWDARTHVALTPGHTNIHQFVVETTMSRSLQAPSKKMKVNNGILPPQILAHMFILFKKFLSLP